MEGVGGCEEDFSREGAYQGLGGLDWFGPSVAAIWTLGLTSSSKEVEQY